MPRPPEVLQKRILDADIHYSEDLEEYSEIHDTLMEVAEDIPQLLGYERDNIFTNINYIVPEHLHGSIPATSVTFEVIVADSPAAEPHLAIKLKLREESPVRAVDDPNDDSEKKLVMSSRNELISLFNTSGAEYTVVLSNQHIAVEGFGFFRCHNLSTVSVEEIEEISEELSPPDELPKSIGTNFPPGHHPLQTKLTRWLFGDSEITPGYKEEVENANFHINIDRYSRLLYDAYSAESQADKGNSLEDASEYLLDGLKMVEVRDTNLNTKTGEIDIILEYKGHSETNLFEYHSRFVLVECKNVNSSVSTKEIGHFEKKLRKRQLDLGILIAWNGVSGEESGDDGKRYIDNPGQNDPFILVLDSEDLYSVMDGKCLYEIIDENLYDLRFDI